MARSLLLLAFLSGLGSFSWGDEPPRPLVQLRIEEILQISVPEDLFTLANERGTRLADLLQLVTDEKSALRLNGEAQRYYLELQTIDARIGMLPPPTREIHDRLTPIVNQMREMRYRLLKQCERLERSPKLAQVMDPVLRPLYRDVKGQAQAMGRSLLSQLQTIRAQLELYKLQHNDKLPDFRNQGWSQLTSKTRPDGQKADDGQIGPYLQSPPLNPFLNRSRILVARSTPKKDFRYSGGDCGFILDESTGRVWAIDGEGRIFNEAQAAQADVR